MFVACKRTEITQCKISLAEMAELVNEPDYNRVPSRTACRFESYSLLNIRFRHMTREELTSKVCSQTDNERIAARLYLS